MRIRMKVDVSGLRDGEPWPAKGGECVVPDDEGADLCSQGIAEPVAEPAKAEKRASDEDDAAKPKRRSAK